MIKLIEGVSRIAGKSGFIRDNYLFLRRKSKKGFLLGEFNLKLIIAIICIIILLYLLFNLYATFTNKGKIQQAESSLDRVIEGIGITESSGSKYQYVLTEPRDWLLLYFGSGVLKPKSCENKECICICEKPGWFSSNQASKCESVGVCKITSRKINIENGINGISINPSESTIKKQNNEISIRKI